jgi:probable HAF family extracellular repeat protein
MRKLSLASVLVSAAAAVGGGGALAQSYTVHALATLGGSSNYGQALNNKGQVVGFSATAGNVTYDPYLTGANGVGIADIGSLGGYTLAYAVNDVGQVAGYGQPAGFPNGQAFLTGPNGARIAALGTLSAGTYSRATGVDNTGQVVGFIGNGNTNTDTAFIIRVKGGALQTLGTLGGASSDANAINGSGRIAGYAETAVAADDAFITGPDGGPMRDLGIGPDSFANAINNNGQVAGTAYNTSNGTYAFVTTTNGGAATQLGNLGGTNAAAFGVSNAGQVVGWAQTATGNYHAFVYGTNGMIDLNSLVTLVDGAYLIQATAINDRGQIVAQASDNDTYLLSPPVSQQMGAVLQIVTNAAVDSSLAGKMAQAQAYYAAHDAPDACFMLASFEYEARAQAGEKLTQSFSLELVADAQGLMAAIRCND